MMKTKFVVFLLALVQFMQLSMFIPASIAKITTECTSETPSVFRISLDVDQDGYFDKQGVIRASVDVPANTCIEVLLSYVGDPNGDSSNVHAFGVTPRSEDDPNEYESEGQIGPLKFADTVKTTSLFFPSGAKGLNMFDLYCVYGDCDGMEHLIDLIVNVF